MSLAPVAGVPTPTPCFDTLMPSFTGEFLSLALIHFLAVVAPGPDFAVTIRQSLVFGRRAGVYTALGIGTGISVHVIYTLFGVGALMHSTRGLLQLAELAGSAYLFYLGLVFIRHAGTAVPSAPDTAPASTSSVQSPARAFGIGFFTNATNPKATLFFLAVFTTVVSSQTPLLVQAAYGLWMCLVNALWFVVVSLIFTQQSIRTRFLAISALIERLIGGLLLIFALRLLWQLGQSLLS